MREWHCNIKQDYQLQQDTWCLPDYLSR